MKAFVDTNILAYRLDPSEPAKQARAIEWLTGPHDIVISTQVLIELHSLLTRRFGVSRALAREVIEAIKYDTVGADRALVERAVGTAEDHQLSIFDAMILEAAASAGCEELWSEDLAAGTSLRGVRIVNPFDGLERQ